MSPDVHASQPDVIVVGAGLSGLVAATALAARGARVVVLDKGRGPGGRLATRRLEAGGNRARLDHGAQFLTVRSDAFAALVADWPLRVWHHGGAQARHVQDPPSSATTADDGHPRYAAEGGMNAIAKHLARGLDVRTAHRVQVLRPTDGGWLVQGEGDLPDLRSPRVLLTAPVPQTIAMLPDLDLPPAVTALTYDSCIGLLLVLDAHPAFARHCAVRFAEGPVQVLADNASKGISAAPAVTVHAHGDWSGERFDDDDTTIADVLGALVAPWLDAAVLDQHVKRWRYATPRQAHPDRAVVVADGLVLAGDAFGGPKVEGAALSGLAAADLLG